MEEIVLKIAAISLFVVMYILMILIPKRRSFVALGAAIIYVILGILPVRNVLLTGMYFS